MSLTMLKFLVPARSSFFVRCNCTVFLCCGLVGVLNMLLQAGSIIVENLRTYKQPVMVYLPPGAELRGGAWVVIDGQINSQQVIVNKTRGNLCKCQIFLSKARNEYTIFGLQTCTYAHPVKICQSPLPGANCLMV